MLQVRDHMQPLTHSLSPELGLAEAIIDLVSTGSTLVMNGLRQIGDVLPSEAVLVANPAAHRERSDDLAAIDTMLSAVIAARGRKYLMMNAPASHLPELEALLPALESPTIIPLAHDGMVAANYSEAKMSAYMKKQELEVSIDVGVGRGHASIWTCDLTKQYVAINGDYRS